MTETEAKTKWCPFGRVGHREGMALNDPNLPNFSVRCIGSGCMAWRWSGHIWDRLPAQLAADGVFKMGDREPPRPSRVPASWQWMVAGDSGLGVWREPWPDSTAKSDEGYCGLAGVPPV